MITSAPLRAWLSACLTAPASAMTKMPRSCASGTTSAVSPRPMIKIGTFSSRITRSCSRVAAGVFTQLLRSGGCGVKPSLGISSSLNLACLGNFSWISLRTSSGSGILTSSIFGKVMSTPKGLSVSCRTARMRSRITSGRIELPPMQPSPPAFDTAATSAGGVVRPSLSQPMPAWMIGYLICNKSHNGVCKDIKPPPETKVKTI